MEFNEKLQFFRKKSGLTQEQLAEKLNISRTAVSKWESGRGFPNIEALKNISKVFQVPIDDLLSGDELITIAERDNAADLDKAYSLNFGVLDLLSLAFIFLPLYGQEVGGHIRSVNLLHYSEVSDVRVVHFILLITLAALGAAEMLIQFFDNKKALSTARLVSILWHSVAVLFFTLTREPYVTFFSLVLLLSKILLLFRKSLKK
ncbi:MAG TPA: helix-turn-helix transcriptional regulator [Rectinemataceae bacterium]|nr:helix-turn-helix transcriptional regulator [Rectinemataceae bacterium]